jgi:hypothetical protein
MLAALLVVLCLVPGALGASRFHERNHTGLLFLYTFDEGQVPTSPPTQVRDVSGRYLMGNLSTSPTGAVTWDAARQGMTVPSTSGGSRAVSQLTSENALSALTNEFSLEFFFSTPFNSLSEDLLIAGFGDWAPGSPLGRCNASDTTSEGGWRLVASVDNVVEFFTVLSVSGTPTCGSVAPTVVVDSLRHLVVRIRGNVLTAVSHGNTVTNTAPGLSFDPAIWARHFAPLTLASPHVDRAWVGSLYMVAMYDRYLSNAEIAANLALGPPNSFPYGGGTLEVDEDVSAALVDAV